MAFKRRRGSWVALKEEGEVGCEDGREGGVVEQYQWL